MRPDDPRHGKYSGWQAHRNDGEPICDPCILAAYRYHKRKHARLEAGIRNRITLGHKAWAIIHNNPRRAVSRHTGIRVAKLCVYHNGGPDTPVLRATRDKIESFTGETTITAVGVQRRIRALNRLGYSAQAIADAAGCHVESIKDSRRHSAKYVKTDYAQRVAAAYERLSMTLPPPSRHVSKARNHGERMGWAAPLEWDEGTIDDPTARPYRAAFGDVGDTTRTRAAELEHFAHMGDTLETVCERLHVERKSLLQWCDRHGHLDVYERLAERTRTRENQYTSRSAA